ncbi:MAG TPA: glutamate--tRNA ligase [Nitrospinaceae bacterium]|nr:glutamate--tRNA ligase [Nitrospinaceae bacterium]
MKSRFAPSPTGYLHIGGARTALFAWLWAKKHHSKFVLRIEDTDKERSTQDSVEAILQGIDWLGLSYDEGPIYQSGRVKRYKEVISQLLDEGKAYYCECTKERLEEMREAQIASGDKPKYDGCCRDKRLKSGVVRFLNSDNGPVSFNDYVKGKIEISNSELDDLIVARSDGSPTYNLTVVVDDHDMEIECVIRGDDHINNTPKQINLYEALNWNIPRFAHVPMILDADGSRLSKRHGAIDLMSYRDEGFLPKALLNYIVRLGWSHGDQEIFSVDEMINLFELKNINKSSASFNQEKLDWINQSYIKTTEINELVSELEWHLNQLSIDLSDGPDMKRVVEALRDRSKSLVDMAQNCVMFYHDFEDFNSDLAMKFFHLESRLVLDDLLINLNSLEQWTAQHIHEVIQEICESRNIGFGKVGQPFRLAISGDGKAGSIDKSAQLVGKKRVLLRLKMAIDWIDSLSS